jgi:hypothetical protein
MSYHCPNKPVDGCDEINIDMEWHSSSGSASEHGSSLSYASSDSENDIAFDIFQV